MTLNNFFTKKNILKTIIYKTYGPELLYILFCELWKKQLNIKHN